MKSLRPQKIYNFSFIKELKDYDIALKQSLKYCDRNKYCLSNSGILYSFRWSIEIKEFVLDFNTSKKRDIEGISSINADNDLIKYILESINEKSDVFGDFNLKNPYKLLVFEVNNETRDIYFFGIWNRHKTKNREGYFDLKKRNFSILDFKFNIEDIVNIEGLRRKDFKMFNYSSYRLLYEDLMNTTLSVNLNNNINSLTVKDILFKYKNVKVGSLEYNIITNKIENTILDLIKEDKIIYQHEDYLVSISKKIKKEEDIKDLKTPLGIFTI